MTKKRINTGVLGVHVYEVDSSGYCAVSYWTGIFRDDDCIGSRILIADIRIT